ncbi:MAG: right-handed parallel beta-helix repeat-containing protein [Methylocella sp.]
MIGSQLLKRKLVFSSRFPFTLLLSPLAYAVLFLPCLGAGPAEASSLATFVSGKGTDSGTCAATNPCRSFQFAIDQTSPGGAVKVLDPANYGSMIITQSMSIAGIEGAGINRSAGDAITINAGPNDVVNLSHLTLDGLKVATHGIVLNSAGSLTVTDCVVRNFLSDGITLQPAAAAKFLIKDTLVSNNIFGSGISVRPQGTGLVQGDLDHVAMNKNDDGLVVFAPADITVVDSSATRHPGTGISVQPGAAVVRLAHSTITGNFDGVFRGGTVETFGDNHIHGNTHTDGFLPLTNVGTQ